MGLIRIALRAEARFAAAWALILGVLGAAVLLVFRPFAESASAVQFVESLPAPVIAFFGLGRVTTPEGFVEATLFEFIAPIGFLCFAIGVGSRQFATRSAGSLPTPPGVSVRTVLAAVAALSIGAVAMALALAVGMAAASAVAGIGFHSGNVASAIGADVLLAISFGILAMIVGTAARRAGLAAAVATVVALASDAAYGLAAANPGLDPVRYASIAWYAEGGEPVALGVPIERLAVLFAAAAALAALLSLIAWRSRAQAVLADAVPAEAVMPDAVMPDAVMPDAVMPDASVEPADRPRAAARPAGVDNPVSMISTAGEVPRDSSSDIIAKPVREPTAGWLSPGAIVGVGLGILGIAALITSGFVTDSQATLQIMGFDPDRAALIMSLVAGALTSALAALGGARPRVAVPLGAGVVLVMFFPIFQTETKAAVDSQGPDGTFYPLGWAVSAFTLVGAAIVVGWAADLIAIDLRRRAKATLGATRLFWSGTAGRTRDALPIWLAVGSILGFAVGLPVFADMMNFDPDVHMRQGAPPGVALFGSPDESAGPRPTDDALVLPPALVAGPLPGSFVSAGALDTAKPWAAHPPTGAGRTASVSLPAPWTGGIRTTASIGVYFPPGYDTGLLRYPVTYEAPQPLADWEKAVGITSLLDSLILGGQIPPQIVVFVSQFGGPYPDSQCADSWDGKEWFDRYLAIDVPTWVDANFRTIATPAARALLGFSEGGYCAAAGITHHPDVFGTAGSFSGYFASGITTSTTPTAGRPFNNDPALEARVSPIIVAARLSETDRNRIFLVFAADPSSRFYGNQITEFAAVLNAAGIPFGILPTPLGHSWAAVREQLPDMLALLASRQVHLGVFDVP